MAAENRGEQLVRALVMLGLLQSGPHKSVDLAAKTGIDRRTVNRILQAIRDASDELRKLGLDWYEITTEKTGLEQWHRAVRKPGKGGK